MLSLEALESQVCAVMESVVTAAVTELSSLLERSSANVNSTMATQQHRSAAASLTSVKHEEEESEVTPPEDRQQLNKAITVTHTLSW